MSSAVSRTKFTLKTRKRRLCPNPTQSRIWFEAL